MDEEETSFVIYEGVVVPESALLRRANKYGSIEGLPDEELADPDELERMVYKEMWGPVLALPVQGNRGSIRPTVDEDGRVDWGAFGTVDFDRYRPELDKARYKADRLREQLKDLLIMVSIVSERIPGKAKYKVLKYLKMGIIELEQIANDDMLALARLWLRAGRLRQEITELQEASRRRKEQRVKAWLEG